MDAPGRRGRFATWGVAKSSDDARAEGASDGIVSYLFMRKGGHAREPKVSYGGFTAR